MNFAELCLFAQKRPKQNKYLVCLGRTISMSVVPPSFMANKLHPPCSLLPVTRDDVDPYTKELSKHRFFLSKSKLQGAFPPRSRRIFTSHPLSALSGMCTTPLLSRFSYGAIILEIFVNVNLEKINQPT